MGICVFVPSGTWRAFSVCVLLGLTGCTQITPEVALGVQDKQPTAENAWLEEFTESKARGFRPVHSPTGLQCTRQSLSGSWRQAGLKERSAVWAFGTTGQIKCQGGGCQVNGSTPRRYAMREVFLNTPRANVGLLIISSNDLVERRTCEIENGVLLLGDEEQRVTRFHRETPA